MRSKKVKKTSVPFKTPTSSHEGGVTIRGGQNTFQGDVVGRDKTTYSVEYDLSSEVLNSLFQPLINVAHEAEPEKEPEATQKVEALKEELGKGKQADDRHIAKLLDGIIELVPGAVGTVTSIFASPILGGLTGPVTKFVLDKLQGK